MERTKPIPEDWRQRIEDRYDLEELLDVLGYDVSAFLDDTEHIIRTKLDYLDIWDPE